MQPQLCFLFPVTDCSEQLSNHILCAVHGSLEETEVHWNFKCFFKAGLEMRSHCSFPKAHLRTRISMQGTQLLICLCLGSMPSSALCSCLCPSSSIPRKDPGGLDSSCPTLTLCHGPHGPQRQQVSGLQQVLSPSRLGLHMQH